MKKFEAIILSGGKGTRVKKYTKFYLVGDLNLPRISAENWEDAICPHRFEQEFLDMYNDFDLKQIIREATHVKGNILDVLLTNNVQSINNLVVLDHKISIWFWTTTPIFFFF